MSLSPDALLASTPETRRALFLGIGRSLLTVILLIAVYFTVPLTGEAEAWIWISLLLLLVLLVAVIAWEVRSILKSPHPGIRGIEAMAVIAPMFLLIFAVIYFVLAESNSANFNEGGLTRIDALYFTLTILVTTGFGDIYAASQVARVVVMMQMIFDLLLIGVVLKVVYGAVQFGKKLRDAESASEPSD